MNAIYLQFLTQKKDAKRLSYDTIAERTKLSPSKLQRIFTGQVDASVDDFELIIEKGLQADVRDVYARIGEQEARASEPMDFKGTEKMLEDFAAEKAQIRHEYEERLVQAEQARVDALHAFDASLLAMQQQYKETAAYLTGLVKKAEEHSEKLAARAARAEEIAEQAHKRADEAERRADRHERSSHSVFWAMLGLCGGLLILLVLGIVLDLPMLGLGNG